MHTKIFTITIDVLKSLTTDLKITYKSDYPYVTRNHVSGKIKTLLVVSSVVG